VFSRYGYPNDLLARLHAAGARVVDVPVRPVYGSRWKSGIRLHTVVYPIAFVLARSWLERLGAEARGAGRPEWESRAHRAADDVVSAISG
jgi:hypothetical protein